MPSTLKNINLWKNGIIPYVPNEKHPQWHTIIAAMKEFEDKTNIKFIERTNEIGYIVFTNNHGGNYANLGMCEGESIINIVASYRNIHELGHVIGLIHEHQRSDRDEFIDFDYKNFTDINDPWIQHDILYKHNNSINLTPYDINSVMHYWTSAGGKKATVKEYLLGKLKGLNFLNSEYQSMQYKPNKKLCFNTPEVLSNFDAEGINRLYSLDIIMMPFYNEQKIILGSKVVIMHLNSKNCLYSGSDQTIKEVGCFWKLNSDMWWNFTKIEDNKDMYLRTKTAINLVHESTRTPLSDLLMRNQNNSEISHLNETKDIWQIEKIHPGIDDNVRVGDIIRIYNLENKTFLSSSQGDYSPINKYQMINSIKECRLESNWIIVSIN